MAWSPKEAAIKAMENVQGPVIGIAFVLSAVFIPVAFMGGMTGILYKQFALTMYSFCCYFCRCSPRFNTGLVCYYVKTAYA